MGHIVPPFGGDGSTKVALFGTEREHNLTMMYVDVMLALLGGITSIFGLYVEGITPLLAFLLLISVTMAIIARIRYSREREMKLDALGEGNGDPSDTC